jgi:hypothetical protein
LLQKLQLEVEKHVSVVEAVEDLTCQLEQCKRDLNPAEKERATAMVSSMEAEALKKQLSAKGEEVFCLSSQVSQLERELRLKVEAEERLLGHQLTFRNFLLVRP